jgi:hypothetical protein
MNVASATNLHTFNSVLCEFDLSKKLTTLLTASKVIQKLENR